MKTLHRNMSQTLTAIVVLGLLIAAILSYVVYHGIQYRVGGIWENHFYQKMVLTNTRINDQLFRLDFLTQALQNQPHLDRQTIQKAVEVFEKNNSSYLGGVWIPAVSKGGAPIGLKSDLIPYPNRIKFTDFNSVRNMLLSPIIDQVRQLNQHSITSFPMELATYDGGSKVRVLAMVSFIHHLNKDKSEQLQGVWVSLIDQDAIFQTGTNKAAIQTNLISYMLDSKLRKLPINNEISGYRIFFKNSSGEDSLIYPNPSTSKDLKKIENNVFSKEADFYIGDSVYRLWAYPLNPISNGRYSFLVALAGVVMTLATAGLAYRGLRLSRINHDKKGLEDQITQKNEFFDTLAHELRTPLNGMIGMSELLTQTKLSAEQNYYANTVRLSGLSMRWTIDQTLTLSKLNMYDFDIQSELFKINDLLDAILDILGPLANLKQLRFSYFIHSDLIDRELIGDQLRIRQALINLVGNAINYTQFGEVFIRVRPSDSELALSPDFITFEVMDTGKGISQEDRAKLFKKFSRIKKTDSTETAVGGLGLHITLKIIKKMKGWLDFDSTLDEGSRFYFHIPLERSSATYSEHDLLKRLSGKKVALVANSESVLGKLADKLKDSDCEIQLIPNYLSARKYFARSKKTRYKPDVLIIDELVDQLSGYDLYRHCIAWLTDVYQNKTLFLYSNTSIQTRYQLHESGIKNHVLKPLNELYLLRRIQEIASQTNVIPLDIVGNSEVQESLFEPKFKILIADDNLVNLEILVLMLHKIGHMTVTATNGNEVVEKLRSEDFDLILMDINMPGKTGIESALEIREFTDHKKDTPIIAMTANLGKEFEDLYYSKGMNGFIAKPIELEKLDNTIQKVMGLIT